MSQDTGDESADDENEEKLLSKWLQDYTSNYTMDIIAITVPLGIVQDPFRLFMAIKFNFAEKNDIPIQNVIFKGIFIDNAFPSPNKEDRDEDELDSYPNIVQMIGEEASDYAVCIKDLLLVGVNWDFER